MSTSGPTERVRAFAEPEERDDPRNRLIEAFDAQLQAMLDNGFEAQVRAIVARHLPPPKPAESLAPAVPPDPNLELELTILIADLKRCEKLKMAAIAHQALARIRARAESDLTAIKHRRTP